MAVLEYDELEIKQIVDRLVKRTINMDHSWNWPTGVAFYGICKAWEATGNEEYIDFLVKWVEEYLEIGLPPMMVNAVSMGHTMLTLYEATGDEKYMDIAMKKVDYLNNEALRFGEGVFQHTVSANNDFPQQAWADTLFMAAYFLLRMGVKLNKKEYIEDSMKQYYWHEEFLQDEKTNLYYHGWDNIKKNHMSGIFWARGNSWAALTMAEALQLVPPQNPYYMSIDGSLRDLLSSLVRLQSGEGLWHTILTDSSSYEEISASAGFAASLVVYGHPLHKKYVAKAMKGILNNISEDGTVKNVSAGTAVMDDARDYIRVPKKRIQGWGQGLALAFLSAVLKHKP